MDNKEESRFCQFKMHMHAWCVGLGAFSIKGKYKNVGSVSERYKVQVGQNQHDQWVSFSYNWSAWDAGIRISWFLFCKTTHHIVGKKRSCMDIAEHARKHV